MKKAFSLIELIVTLVILAIILAVSIPKFQSWLKKERLKKDVYYLYAILQKTRNRAFLTKENYTIRISGKEVVINSNVINLDTKFFCKSKNRSSICEFNATSRGTFSKLVSIVCPECEKFNLPYNCIVVTYYNLRIAKCRK